MRLVGLDVFRGHAIFLMIIFHLFFDLNNFHILDIDILHGAFWKYFRYFIVCMFLFSAGISIKLANENGLNFTKLKKRILILALASLFVSIGSYTQFPNSWIYFGILHFFLFASIFGLLFLHIPKTSLIVAILIITAYNIGTPNMHWLFNILQEPLNLPIKYTEDLVGLFPWFGVFLLGMVFSSYNLHLKFFDNSFYKSDSKINIVFAYMGKNSLLIYLLHQPLLFGVFFAIT
ncbi:heparan-alpha-glucosaminide N-acetyltransferase [Sulfurimonas sp.]|jgi:uncharacterized membrane protein|uniref:heparan-alpha-glucosaminide N-acetyltransferase n=1 Tax=Sulfurimonas sp. TaxID=2022749 RepID=UPI0025D8D63D|nr:heparan-alpha-glucosaminide N-acetyltransferase [Sulfurimonas sp.]MBT5933864.1 DUF1624 domain-containing protein [Sulfurimonas sp.]